MNKLSLIWNDVEIERQLFTKTNMHAYCISLKMKNFQSEIHYQPINYYNVTYCNVAIKSILVILKMGQGNMHLIQP